MQRKEGLEALTQYKSTHAMAILLDTIIMAAFLTSGASKQIMG